MRFFVHYPVIMRILDCDYFVVGSGIAGLMSAIGLSRHGKVIIATKKNCTDSNTNYAQGGIACVIRDDDSFADHIADTLDAGAGLCDESVVKEIVSGGPERIAELEQLGMEFAANKNLQDGSYDLGKEGGHSHRRVFHAGDITGAKVEAALLAQVAASPNVTICDHFMVVDLITTSWLGADEENRCVGAYVLDSNSRDMVVVRAPHVILASGGGGKVYLYTSNPDIATGDGVAMAWRAGVPIANMEFIQFHPTCLHHPDAKSFLISEAVRGEGATLVDAAGKPFMDKYDERLSLAPRDIVARAIDHEMKERGELSMYLDARHKSEEFLKERFANIYKACLGFGIDMAHDLIPVVPAAHYFCGGVKAGIDGKTDLDGLYACGEVACTGLHGANRLASNSLLEALVCSHEMVKLIETLPKADFYKKISIPDWEFGDAVRSDEQIVVEHNWSELRTCMWDYVGIVRTDKRLERAYRRIRNLKQEIREYYLDYLVTPDMLELRNIAAVAELIVQSAMQRKESRGLHYTLDYPDILDDAKDTIITRKVGG